MIVFIQVNNKKNSSLNKSNDFVSNIDNDTSFNYEFEFESSFNRTRRRNQQRRKFKTFKLFIIKIMKIKINVIDYDFVNAILDCDVECNLINKSFVKKLNFISFDAKHIDVIIVNKFSIIINDVYFSHINIKNRLNHDRYFKKFFLNVDIDDDVILNMSWFKLINSQIDWIDKDFAWKLNLEEMFHITKRIENIKSNALINDILKNQATTFIMIVRVWKQYFEVLKNVHVSRQVQINNALIKNENKLNFRVVILDVLKIYENLSNENKIYKLSKYDLNDHVINLIDEKQFSHDFIYLLLKAKLKVLKTYINKHLVNDFIRSFKLSIDVSILFVRKKNDSLRLCVNYQDLNTLIVKNRYSLSFIDESLNRFNRVKRFTNWNLTILYHKMSIKKSDE